MFSILNLFTNFRTLGLTLVCFCGAFLDVFLHYFELWEHRHGYGVVISAIVTITITLALIWLAREHYRTHKEDKERDEREARIKRSPFALPTYTVRTWLPPYFVTNRGFFTLGDDSAFQTAFNEFGYVPAFVIKSVVDRWNKEAEEKNTGNHYRINGV